jgi:hypothetical protein
MVYLAFVSGWSADFVNVHWFTFSRDPLTERAGGAGTRHPRLFHVGKVHVRGCGAAALRGGQTPGSRRPLRVVVLAGMVACPLFAWRHVVIPACLM